MAVWRLEFTRGDQIAQLIDGAGKGAACAPRRQFIEMRRHHAPGALDEELHRKGADAQHQGGGRIGPEIGDRQRQQGRGDDGAAASKPLAQGAEQHAAQYGADIIGHRDGGDRGMAEAVLLLQEERIEILGAMAEEGEGGHQGDGVKRQPPMLAQHRYRGGSRRISAASPGIPRTLKIKGSSSAAGITPRTNMPRHPVMG